MDNTVKNLKNSEDVIKPYIDKFFENKVLPGIMDFIRIPNVSPSYNPNWDIDGNQEKAAQFLANWVISENKNDLALNIYKEVKRMTFIYIEITPTRLSEARRVIIYDYLDKPPAFSGWSDGLSPTKPVVKDSQC